MRLLIAVGAVLTFLLLSLILTKRRKTYPDRFLILYLGFAFLNQLYVYAETTEVFQSSYWMLLGKGLILINPPLFFLYIYAVAKQRSLSLRYTLLTLMPFVAYFLHFLYFYLFVFDTHTISVESGVLFVDGQLSLSWMVFIILFLLIEPFFLICFYVVLKSYKQTIKASVSSLEKMQLGWLNIIFYLSLIIAVILVSLGTLAVTSDWIPTSLMQIAMEIMVVIFYFILGFYGFRQTTVFTNLDFVERSPVRSKGSYEKSGLDASQLAAYHAQLLALMDEKKLYLNGELTASELSAQLGMSVNNLSQVLNQVQQQNFFDFINSYRVKEVMARMTDPRYAHLTLLAIALDSGFNSKASFNAVFKKNTGQTPSQYLKTRENAAK